MIGKAESDAAEKDKETAKTEKEKAKKEAEYKKQVDDYNSKGYKDDTVTGYNKDPKDYNKNENKTFSNKPLLETWDRFEATGDDVFGRGTSTYEFSRQGNQYVDNNPKYREINPSSPSKSKTLSLGKRTVAGYLEDKRN